MPHQLDARGLLLWILTRVFRVFLVFKNFVGLAIRARWIPRVLRALIAPRAAVHTALDVARVVVARRRLLLVWIHVDVPPDLTQQVRYRVAITPRRVPAASLGMPSRDPLAQSGRQQSLDRSRRSAIGR